MLAREITNGMWAVSGLALLAVIIGYIVNAARHRPLWWRDPGVQFAAAMGLLVLGHVIRAGFSWAEFVELSRGALRWTFPFVSELYFTAMAFTVVGKLLCIYVLMPPAWRWRVIAAALLLTIGIPVGVYWLV